jgi:hypothetical protein
VKCCFLVNNSFSFESKIPKDQIFQLIIKKRLLALKKRGKYPFGVFWMIFDNYFEKLETEFFLK